MTANDDARALLEKLTTRNCGVIRECHSAVTAVAGVKVQIDLHLRPTLFFGRRSFSLDAILPRRKQQNYILS